MGCLSCTAGVAPLALRPAGAAALVIIATLLLLATTPAHGATWGVPTPSFPDYPCKTTLPDTTSYRTVWVNPRAKAGGGDGSEGSPFRTFAQAMGTVPQYSLLAQGVHVRLLPGVSGSGADTYWLEGRWGTANASIVVTGEGGSRRASDLQSINVFNCSYLYFSKVTFKQPARAGGGGSLVHFASCDYVWLLGCSLIGSKAKSKKPQETLKVNQVTAMYVEDSSISNAGDNVLDWVAVQYGHICRNTMTNSNWGMYVKGGAAYVLIDGNTVTASGESAIRVGQGTGFEYMVSPHLNYEAVSVRVTNNVVSGAFGAGLGVAGGYDVLVAHNTVIKSGKRSHMAEFLFGSRSCDGDADLPGRCDAYLAAGGWGAPTGGPAVPIPNRNVLFLNNLMVNTRGQSSAYSHFMAPGAPTDETPGPAPVANASVSDGLVVAGNVIVNGKSGFDIGLTACVDTNPTCNPTQLAAQNAFNPSGLAPKFLKTGELAAASKALVRSAWAAVAVPLSDFPGPWSTPLTTPAPPLANLVLTDARGATRTNGANLPGALL